MERGKWIREFCAAYLRTMDPEQAAKAAGREDGFALLAWKSVRRRLEKMRSAAAEELRREDVLKILFLRFCKEFLCRHPQGYLHPQLVVVRRWMDMP